MAEALLEQIAVVGPDLVHSTFRVRPYPRVVAEAHSVSGERP